MTHSERIAAVRRGQESDEEQRARLLDGVGQYYESDLKRRLGFGIKAEMYRCVPRELDDGRSRET